MWPEWKLLFGEVWSWSGYCVMLWVSDVWEPWSSPQYYQYLRRDSHGLLETGLLICVELISEKLKLFEQGRNSLQIVPVQFWTMQVKNDAQIIGGDNTAESGCVFVVAKKTFWHIESFLRIALQTTMHCGLDLCVLHNMKQGKDNRVEHDRCMTLVVHWKIGFIISYQWRLCV